MKYYILTDDPDLADKLAALMGDKVTDDLTTADSLIVAPAVPAAFDSLSDVWNDFIDDVTWNKRAGSVYITGPFTRRDIPFRLRRFPVVPYEGLASLDDAPPAAITLADISPPTTQEPCRDSHTFGAEAGDKVSEGPCRDSHVFGAEAGDKVSEGPCRDSHVFGAEPPTDVPQPEPDARRYGDSGTRPPKAGETPEPRPDGNTSKDEIDRQWQIIYEEQRKKKKRYNAPLFIIISVIVFVIFISVMVNVARACNTINYYALRSSITWIISSTPLSI